MKQSRWTRYIEKFRGKEAPDIMQSTHNPLADELMLAIYPCIIDAVNKVLPPYIVDYNKNDPENAVIVETGALSLWQHPLSKEVVVITTIKFAKHVVWRHTE